MDYFANTNIGKVRTKNQDQATVYANGKDQVLLTVCDGMGGHKSGEVASRVVSDYIVGCFRSHPGFSSVEEAMVWLEQTILDSHKLVQKMASTSSEHEGMGTTVVSALLIDGKICIGHVGDSRAYLIQKNELKQLTKDHTLVNALLDKGAIKKEEVHTHAKKNVLLQALGATPVVTVSMNLYDEVDGILLLCSDGLYNMVDEQFIEEAVRLEMSVTKIVEVLINEANKNGGRDNIAVAMMKMEGEN